MKFTLYKEILAIRPDWGIPKRAEDESALPKEQLDKLMPLERIKLVATQGANDEKELFDLCGIREDMMRAIKRYGDKQGNPVPEWDDEVFEQVLEQAENFKKYAD
ncbi:MAG: DUF3387 domain-containing protein [Synergistaceae bacterium]|nr:DUF3387 domain-containing protein [Synergistaceae bacterium]